MNGGDEECDEQLARETTHDDGGLMLPDSPALVPRDEGGHVHLLPRPMALGPSPFTAFVHVQHRGGGIGVSPSMAATAQVKLRTSPSH
jgi:hypothetical protein